MGRNCITSKGLGPVRLAATVTVGLACLATSVVAHPVTLHMAFISEADDGLTRQSVDALARAETVHRLTPPSEYTVAPSEPSASPASPGVRRVAARHHRHHAKRSGAPAAAVATGPKPRHRPWLMARLVALTNWWNGWAEKNLHTSSLDVHLDRPAHPDRKTA